MSWTQPIYIALVGVGRSSSENISLHSLSQKICNLPDTKKWRLWQCIYLPAARASNWCPVLLCLGQALLAFVTYSYSRNILKCIELDECVSSGRVETKPVKQHRAWQVAHFLGVPNRAIAWFRVVRVGKSLTRFWGVESYDVVRTVSQSGQDAVDNACVTWKWMQQ